MRLDLPPLPAAWLIGRLDRVATVNARIGWKALTADEYVPEGYSFLSTPNIKSDEIDFDDVNFISEFRYLESPELQLRLGDVLLVKDGNTLGITNVVRRLPRPATVNGSIAVLRPFAMNSRFLRYALASSLIQGLIGAFKAGMGVPHLFQADIKKFPLPLPPPAVQSAIADFLDTETLRIDALIENKRRVLELATERLLCCAATMTQAADAARVPLRRVIRSLQTGTTPPTREVEMFSDDQVPWFSPGDFVERARLALPSRYLSHEAIRTGAAPLFPADSTLVVGIGATAGRVAHLESPASGNQQLTCLVAGERMEPRFLTWQLWSRRRELLQTAPMTTLPIISNDFLKSLTVTVPPRSVQVSVVSRLDADSTVLGALASRLERQAKLLSGLARKFAHVSGGEGCGLGDVGLG